MGFTVWAGTTSLILYLMAWRQLNFTRSFEDLKDQPSSKPGEWPQVSLIVPACNEADTVGAAVLSLLKIDYPNLEVLVINDRSTDATGRILRDIQRREPRLKIEDLSELPEGWLGKVHALERGAALAHGEWILFSDADVHFAPQALRKAVLFAEENRLGFLHVVPEIRARGLVLQSFLGQFLQMASLAVDPRKTRDPQRPEALGGGAFNLARRDIYARSGGFEWLRLEVIDDAGLAYVMKCAGARCDVLGGLSELSVEWYPSVRAYIRGMEKNGFAIFQYSLPAVLIFVALTWIFFLGLAWAPWVSGSLAVQVFAAGALLFFMFATRRVLVRMERFSPLVPLFVMPAMAAATGIALRNAFLFLKRGGMYWRGTFYSRQALVLNQRLKPLDFIFGRGEPPRPALKTEP